MLQIVAGKEREGAGGRGGGESAILLFIEA